MKSNQIESALFLGIFAFILFLIGGIVVALAEGYSFVSAEIVGIGSGSVMGSLMIFLGSVD